SHRRDNRTIISDWRKNCKDFLRKRASGRFGAVGGGGALEALFGGDDTVFVVLDLVVEAVERLLHHAHPLNELLALLDENRLAGGNRRVPLLEQGDVLDERLDLHAGLTEALHHRDPAARFLRVVAHAAFAARDGRNQADSLIVAQR